MYCYSCVSYLYVLLLFWLVWYFLFCEFRLTIPCFYFILFYLKTQTNGTLIILKARYIINLMMYSAWFCHKLVSVIISIFSKKNLLLWNNWTNWTKVRGYLHSTLYPMISPFIENSCWYYRYMIGVNTDTIWPYFVY